MQLWEALEVQKGEVVALVGAGGKTSALFTLEQELARQGRKVVVTTTTHILIPQLREWEGLLIEGELLSLTEALRLALLKSDVIIVARAKAHGKLVGIDAQWVPCISKIEGVDCILVEADGAAERLFKAPLSYEPVIPPNSTLVVPIVGIDAVGKPLTSEWVHRPEQVAQLTGLSLGATVTPEAIAQVMLHHEGNTKGTPTGARIVPLINKVDGHIRLALAREVACHLLERGAEKVLLTHLVPRPRVVEVVSAHDDPMISAIVLAAGRSQRMGVPKLGLKLGGKSLIEHVIDNALASKVSEVILVLGPETAHLQPSLKGLSRVKVVENQQPEQGQSTSLRLGLQCISRWAQATLILMGDQPLVTPDIIDALINKYSQSRGPIVAPLYGGQRGSPVLFDRSLLGELMAVEGDKGGREIVEKYKDSVVPVSFAEPLVGGDVDTWEDYMTLHRLQEEKKP
ncbi:molybdenum cofactor cytidylyltransferase [Chloroflexota bacterium]